VSCAKMAELIEMPFGLTAPVCQGTICYTVCYNYRNLWVIMAALCNRAGRNNL